MIEFNIQKSLISKIIILSICLTMVACAAQKAKKCGCPTFGDKKKKKRSDLHEKHYRNTISSKEKLFYLS